MEKFSYLKSANLGYIEELHQRYLEDPNSIDESWRYFFEGLELIESMGPAAASESPKANGKAAPDKPAETAPGNLETASEAKVASLVTAYRELGRLLANIDPLSAPPKGHPLLELSHFDLNEKHLDRSFTAGRMIGLGPAQLSRIIERLKETYCSSIGVEYTHIEDPIEREWLQTRMESSRNRGNFDPETQKHILTRLSESETFERFLHTRYVAQKRFSIEGAENVIPILDCMIETGAELGADEFVIGMAHRGRLNVLTHIFGKKPEHIFSEFEEEYKTETIVGEGDVKYHKGYSADITTRKDKKVHLSLASNPSHLEFVNPVVEGVARAKQALKTDGKHERVIPIAIHGDAAFAGQGVCYETLNLSQLKGYRTGGTLHIVINNQVGFTTSPVDGRSSTYSTDLAKMLEVPIFHVNGDDAEALWYVSELCVEYRQKFKKDVFIDLICYRKHGHNESDEPSFTQPLLYKTIKSKSSPREVYSQKLIEQKVITEDSAKEIIESITERLTRARETTKAETPTPFVSVFEGVWKALRRAKDDDNFNEVQTQVKADVIRNVGSKILEVPEKLNIHSKLSRLIEVRKKALTDEKGFDWGHAESLAFGSLLTEGYRVRLSGQDVERGTFSHRHCVWNDIKDGKNYVPLNHIQKEQKVFQVYNSHLSETGVLGFEYGYSIADPNTLVCWEAQFGDFANGAQVIIDQFISSSESKWQRMTGIVLLLPHGFEGQGPEHSSARLERFLQLCGKNNMIVCNLTTPAQYFHALRRQMLRDFRKPLVIMSPKSLLRHPQAISDLSDFTEHGFQEVLPDPIFSNDSDAAKAKRVILCTGKVYYDLIAEREKREIKDIAILRLEQVYPFPEAQLEKHLARFGQAESILWVQEEPRNMGAWSFVFNMWHGGYSHFQENAKGRSIQYVGRQSGAAPAVGSHRLHASEQADIINKALS